MIVFEHDRQEAASIDRVHIGEERVLHVDGFGHQVVSVDAHRLMFKLV